jgi:hypothetical protein
LLTNEIVISIVSLKHQLRPKHQLFVTEIVISIAYMQHQVRPKKQLFVTECYHYEARADVEVKIRRRANNTV